MDSTQQAQQPPELPAGEEPRHGGFTRFELELEFVQSLGNPRYLAHLATQKYFANSAFVAYLDYLQYWSRPPYLKYLAYPAPTLKALQLLQEERFRKDIMIPHVVEALETEWAKAAVEWQKEEK